MTFDEFAKGCPSTVVGDECCYCGCVSGVLSEMIECIEGICPTWYAINIIQDMKKVSSSEYIRRFQRNEVVDKVVN